MSVLVERQLDFFGEHGAGAGVVQLLTPTPDEGAWRCDYRLSWPGHERSDRALGEDAWQALNLAMRIVPIEIAATKDFKEGRLGCWGKLSSYEQVRELFYAKQIEG